MSHDPNDATIAEWRVLQTQFDSYEKWSLVIKLTHLVIIAIATIFLSRLGIVIIGLSLLFWLTDGVWKTFQSRIETRLLQVESAIAGKLQSEFTPCQFNQAFLDTRPSSMKLIISYVKNALKPTVAYVHVGLIVLYGCVLFELI